MAARLEHAAAASISSSAALSAACEESEPDPELDQFMEAYCEMLTKYHEELTKPFHEAMLGLSKINSQLKALSVSPSYSGDDHHFFMFLLLFIEYMHYNEIDLEVLPAYFMHVYLFIG